MRCVKFDGCNIVIAEGQDEYDTLEGFITPDETQAVICKFTLNAEELKQIAETGEIWVSQLTFGRKYAPIGLSTGPMFFEPEEVCFNFIEQIHEAYVPFWDHTTYLADEVLIDKLCAVLIQFLMSNTEYFTPNNLKSLARSGTVLAEPTETLEHYNDLKLYISKFRYALKRW